MLGSGEFQQPVNIQVEIFRKLVVLYSGSQGAQQQVRSPLPLPTPEMGWGERRGD